MMLHANCTHFITCLNLSPQLVIFLLSVYEYFIIFYIIKLYIFIYCNFLY